MLSQFFLIKEEKKIIKELEGEVGELPYEIQYIEGGKVGLCRRYVCRYPIEIRTKLICRYDTVEEAKVDIKWIGQQSILLDKDGNEKD